MGNANETVECHRCGGSGRLPQFSSVIGGVCFLCHGSGRSSAKPGKSRAARFAVSAICLGTGERVSPIFSVRATSAEKALAMARTQLARGNGYDPVTAEVTPE
jgi:hypothetical protein